MKYIDISKSQKALLCRTFNRSKVTIWSALTFQTHSELAKQIRHTALTQFGGVIKCSAEFTDNFIPNCKTDFEREDGNLVRISHTFSNDVQVAFDIKLNEAQLLHDGRAIKAYQSVVMNDWANILFEAQSFSTTLNN